MSADWEPTWDTKAKRWTVDFSVESKRFRKRLGVRDRGLKDLARAELFAFDRTDQMIDAFAAMGIQLRRDQFPIVTSNHLVQWELCKQGAGVCMMMDEVGAYEPGVVRVFAELPSRRTERRRCRSRSVGRRAPPRFRRCRPGSPRDTARPRAAATVRHRQAPR